MVSFRSYFNYIHLFVFSSSLSCIYENWYASKLTELFSKSNVNKHAKVSSAANKIPSKNDMVESTSILSCMHVERGFLFSLFFVALP